jgi:Zinc carboxypeptidase
MGIHGTSLTVIGLLACVVSGCGPLQNARLVQNQQSSRPVYVRVPTSMLSKEWVQSTGFNRDHAKNNEFALGWLPDTSFAQMAFADRAEIIKLDEQAVSEGRFNPFTLTEKRLSSDVPVASEDYHNYLALSEELRRLADTYPEIARLTSIGKSSQGRELWMMTISDNVDQDEGEPELLYIANMHGDEVVGRELSIYHIRRLLSEYGHNARTTNLVNNSKMFIIASMNPDGFESHQRYSATNVDLNRDFPDFTSDNRDDASGRAVETKAIMDLHAAHHFIATVNFHGGEVCFNLPWDTKANSSPEEKFGDDAVLNPMGRAWADSNPTMVANTAFDRGLTYGYEWYEVDGGMQDWSIWYRRSMHATVELSHVKWPEASYLVTAWAENQEAMFAYHERALTGIHLEVVTAAGTRVPNFEVSINTSTRAVSYDNGIAHRTTTTGPQNISIKVGGRVVAQLTVAARAFDGRFDRVVVGN